MRCSQTCKHNGASFPPMCTRRQQHCNCWKSAVVECHQTAAEEENILHCVPQILLTLHGVIGGHALFTELATFSVVCQLVTVVPQILLTLHGVLACVRPFHRACSLFSCVHLLHCVPQILLTLHGVLGCVMFFVSQSLQPFQLCALLAAFHSGATDIVDLAWCAWLCDAFSQCLQPFQLCALLAASSQWCALGCCHGTMERQVCPEAACTEEEESCSSQTFWVGVQEGHKGQPWETWKKAYSGGALKCSSQSADN